jgi:hypothetical protein
MYSGGYAPPATRIFGPGGFNLKLPGAALSSNSAPQGQRPSTHQAAEPPARHFIPLIIFMNTNSNIDLPDGGKLATLSLITSMSLQRRWLRINETCGT